MVFKAVLMLTIYFTPYFMMIGGISTSPLVLLALWFIMAIGMAGIGLGIMHDANHGAFSNAPSINNLIGKVIKLVGVDQLNWKIQHNVFHHNYTNIEGHDDSLQGGKLLRFSPHQSRLKHHKYQHIYAWFLYPLQTIVWSLLTDFLRLKRYYSMGAIPDSNKSYRAHLIELILWKIFYYGFILVLPIILIDVPWWWTVSFFLFMQLCCGLFLSCVFLSAHIMPKVEYPLPNEGGNIENNWVIHQMYTSCNFATSSRWFSWYVGGLNFQIEHHLFPNICHVHYRAISKILKRTSEKYQLPYFHYKSFFLAVKEHGRMLKILGAN